MSRVSAQSNFKVLVRAGLSIIHTRKSLACDSCLPDLALHPRAKAPDQRAAFERSWQLNSSHETFHEGLINKMSRVFILLCEALLRAVHLPKY